MLSGAVAMKYVLFGPLILAGASLYLQHDGVQSQFEYIALHVSELKVWGEIILSIYFGDEYNDVLLHSPLFKAIINCPAGLCAANHPTQPLPIPRYVERPTRNEQKAAALAPR